MQVGTTILSSTFPKIFMEAAETTQSKAVADLVEATGVGNLEFLSQSFFGNTLLAWVSSAVIFIAVILVLRVILNMVIRKLKKLSQKTSSKLDDAVIGFVESVNSVFYISVALFASVQHLVLPDLLHLIIRGAFVITLVYEVIRLAENILTFFVAMKLGKVGEDETSLSSALSLMLRVVLWTIGTVMILSNLGFNVNSLLASLGIGGLAISLALQPLFSDIFSSFSIILDKPFEEGDFIISGEFKGTVKRIGLKTTRLVALQGEELVISNTELTEARVQNFKRLQKRRIVFGVGVTYDTPPSKLRKIPEMVEKVITEKELAEFDRAHFWEFADSSLNYEIVYYINSSEYADYMATQQAINLEILEAFEKDGIEMAFPTRTVHMVAEGAIA
jgi:small-conductance mechanosensitive channel